MTSLDLQMPSPLPAWLPGETLFSLLSRFHQLSGHRLAADTCRALFGSARAGCQHDFPTRLGELCERVQGALGDPADLACQKTLLPFYLPLQPRDRAREAIDALVGSSKGILKFRLGILTSRFRANHPLKACPECLSADREAFGTAFWHLAHQLPGVWICAAHQATLRECMVKSTGVERFGWSLPDEERLRASMPRTGGPVCASLTKLAVLTEAWSAMPPGTFSDSNRLAAGYLAQVTRLFGGQALAPAAREALSESFCQAIAPLRVVAELKGLPGSAREAWLQIQRWILAPRGSTHPLRHLAIIHWLFEDWPQFLAVYEATGTDQVERPARDSSTSEGLSALEMAFFAGVRNGFSISAAARKAGITANTGMAWAAKHGIAVPHRPKTLRPEVRATVVAELGKGADKAELARLHGLSIQTVTRILQTVPHLREAWQRARHKVARDRARADWREACGQLLGLPITSIRGQAPGAYAWLYRNDRIWLDQHRPNCQVRANANAARIDWDDRDLALSASVRRVAADLSVEGRTARVELWEIYQQLPELKAKLGALARLPLTCMAIQEITGRQRRKPGPRLL